MPSPELGRLMGHRDDPSGLGVLVSDQTGSTEKPLLAVTSHDPRAISEGPGRGWTGRASPPPPGGGGAEVEDHGSGHIPLRPNTQLAAWEGGSWPAHL